MGYKRDIHIVSFNVPYPANYGGVIDVFYKAKALADIGIRVHMHCFVYGRERSEALEGMCHKVYYYKRNIYRDPLFGKLPYIVASRSSNELLDNLLQTDAPILFEGIHCCYLLAHPALKERFKVVRMHNIEHIYYKNLSRIEKNMFKKYFFSVEANRLQVFEKQLKHAGAIAAISPDDVKYLGLRYSNVFYLPVFHSNNQVENIPGFGEYALYQGNLGVGENNEAALFLVNKVFNDLSYPLVIAGNNPSGELKKAVDSSKNVRLVEKLDTKRISLLTHKAHMNVLPTFQNTGMKLKLINALYQGRHCIVNRKMVHNTGLQHLCILADTAEQMKKAIIDTAGKPFLREDISKREAALLTVFSQDQNAMLLAAKMNLMPVPEVSDLLL